MDGNKEEEVENKEIKNDSSMSSSGDVKSVSSVSESIQDVIDTEIDKLLEKKGNYKYTDGWDPDKLEEELKQHPFFITEMPKEGEPLPPLLEAFQQLKYSPDENTEYELALNHKEDGLFHYKLKKYRIAGSCFSEAIRHAEKMSSEDRSKNEIHKSDKEAIDKSTLLAQLYNNRAASQYHIGNYRSSLKDSEKAMSYLPNYFKPVFKAIECCVKMEKWEKVLSFCDIADRLQENSEVTRLRLLAIRNQKRTDMMGRKSQFQEKKREEQASNMLKILKERNVKCANIKFIQDDVAAAGSNGRRVNISTDGRLEWPVLFCYPQYSQTDFIEAFHEDSKFEQHLMEILENDRPGWDSANEYHIDTIDVYFVDLNTSEYVKIDINETLGNVLQHKKFILPPNGVPGFFVLARENQMCKVILERCS